MNRWWFEGKAYLAEIVPVGRDAAHTHIGLLLFLLFCLVLRKFSHGPWWAFALLVVLQGANETMDALDWIGWTGEVNWAETAKDFVLTLLWPFILAPIITVLKTGSAPQEATLEQEQVSEDPTREGVGGDADGENSDDG